MRKFTTLSLALVLLASTALAAAGAVPAAAGSGSGGDEITLLRALGGGTPTAHRHDILRDMVVQRQRIEAILVRDLDSPSNRLKCEAAFLLGQFRMKGAVGALSRRILLLNLHRHVDARLHIVTLAATLLPTVDALEDIGLPAIPAMLSNVRSSPSKLVRNLSVGVLIGIEGYRVTVFRLQRSLLHAHAAATRIKLSQAIALAQTWPKRRKPLVKIEELLKARENTPRATR